MWDGADDEIEHSLKEFQQAERHANSREDNADTWTKELEMELVNTFL